MRLLMCTTLYFNMLCDTPSKKTLEKEHHEYLALQILQNRGPFEICNCAFG
jgi:hypothetical protein